MLQSSPDGVASFVDSETDDDDGTNTPDAKVPTGKDYVSTKPASGRKTSVAIDASPGDNSPFPRPDIYKKFNFEKETRKE